MTKEERLQLIKNIVEKHQPKAIGEIPYTEEDSKDEFSRFGTSLEPLTKEQDSNQWPNHFLQDLIFGTS